MMQAETAEAQLGGAPTLDPVGIVTAAPDPYQLDAPMCVIELEDSENVIAYRLRRPQQGDGAGPDEYLTYARILDRQGKAVADCWLFDQIALAVQPPDAFSWLPLTAERKQQVPDAHKRQAMYARYLCRATVLPEKSEATFSDGSWCVQLEIGPPGALAGVLEFMVEEWDLDQRAEYRHAGSKLAARLPTATRVFNDLFQSCAGGTVADLPFATERRAEFLHWLEAPFKLTLLDALVARWESPAIVESVRFVH